MRIAIFTDSFHPELGGIQDAIAALARGLGARGHSVLVQAPRASSADFARSNMPEQEIELGDNVIIRRRLSLPIPSSSRQSRLFVPTGRGLRDVAAFMPDVIHSHTFLGAGLEALAAAARFRAPVVGTNHWAIREFGSYVPGVPRLAGGLGLSAVTSYYNRCTHVTAPSQSVLDEMKAFGLRRPSDVVSNPIDLRLFNPATSDEKSMLKREFGFSAETILYAGRLAPEKNVDVLVHALAHVHLERPDAMLALAGHGSSEEELRRLVAELELEHRVQFLGTLDHAQLARAMKAADVFAIASTSETQSMVTLQAMSSGLPIVGARWRALPETIGEDAGLLAAPGDAPDFARKIAQVLADPHARAVMGPHGVRRAARSAVECVIDTWEGIYRQLVDAGRSPKEALA